MIMKKNITLLLATIMFFCSCITTSNIALGAEELSVSAVECRMLERVVADELDVIPYATDSIHLFFNTELDEESIIDAVTLMDEEQGTNNNISTTLSEDKKELIVSIEELMSKGSSYILKIDTSIKGADDSALSEELIFPFMTDDKTMQIIIDEYFDENFDDFTSNANGTAFPNGWYRQSGTGGKISLDGMFRDQGVQGYSGDGALKLASETTHQRLMTEFDKSVPYGMPVCVDFDVYRGGGNGFFICMLAEDLDFSGNITLPDGTTHTMDANLTIGSNPITQNADTNCVAPKFGYASDYTNYELKKFTDTSLNPTDEGYYLNLEPDMWHSVHLEMNPIGVSQTTLSVSIDGGKTFNATTKQDFYTHKMAGIALFGLRVFQDKQLEPMDVRFDNIKVYSKEDVQVPVLANTVAVDTDGTKVTMDTPIPSSCTAIELICNSAFDESNIDEIVELSNGTEIVPCTVEVINNNRGIRINPEEELIANSTYKLCLKRGMRSKYSRLLVNDDDQNIYFRTKNDGTFEFISSDIDASGEEAVFSANFKNNAEPDDKYLIAVAEYIAEAKTVNGKLKISERMIDSEFKPVVFDDEGYGMVSKTVELAKSGTGKKFAGFVFKTGGTYVSGAEAYTGGLKTSDAKNITADTHSIVTADKNTFVLPYSYKADGSKACVLVFKGDVDKLNLEDNPVNNNLAYMGLMQNNGNDMVSFFTLAEPGKYTAFILKDNTQDAVRVPFSYVNKTENSAALEAIRSVVAEQSGSEALLNAIDANIVGLAYKSDFYEENDAAAAAIIYDYLVEKYSDNTLVISNEILQELFEKVYLISAIKSDRVNDAREDIYDNSICGSDYEKYYLSKNDQVNKFIINMLKSADSIESYEELLKKAVCLSAISYSGDTQMIKDVVEYLGIDTLSDDIVRSINGKIFYSVEALEKEIKELKNKWSGNGYTGSGSGSGGSGGSYTSKNTQSAAAKLSGSTFPPVSNFNDRESISVFEDIDSVPWAQDAINDLYRRGIVSGRTDNTFVPMDNVLREEFVKMLVETFRLNTIGENMSFEDVKISDWYFEYIARAYYSGIINGEDASRFGAGKDITRQDLAVMLYNTCKVCDIELPDNKTDIKFADSDMIYDYASEAVSSLCSAGIITGYDDGKFHPLDNATRAEAAKLLFNTLQYER